jgi:hypothetical protein
MAAGTAAAAFDADVGQRSAAGAGRRPGDGGGERGSRGACARRAQRAGAGAHHTRAGAGVRDAGAGVRAASRGGGGDGPRGRCVPAAHAGSTVACAGAAGAQDGRAPAAGAAAAAFRAGGSGRAAGGDSGGVQAGSGECGALATDLGAGQWHGAARAADAVRRPADGGPPVGHVDRPDGVHRVQRVHYRVSGGEQHPRGRPRGSPPRQGDALDPRGPLPHRAGG